jgi:hypothetical protein
MPFKKCFDQHIALFQSSSNLYTYFPEGLLFLYTDLELFHGDGHFLGGLLGCLSISYQIDKK